MGCTRYGYVSSLYGYESVSASPANAEAAGVFEGQALAAGDGDSFEPSWTSQLGIDAASAAHDGVAGEGSGLWRSMADFFGMILQDINAAFVGAAFGNAFHLLLGAIQILVGALTLDRDLVRMGVNNFIGGVLWRYGSSAGPFYGGEGVPLISALDPLFVAHDTAYSDGRPYFGSHRNAPDATLAGALGDSQGGSDWASLSRHSGRRLCSEDRCQLSGW